ncbi:hypothetical protein [Rhizobium tubonense]|nr:hypothetical protein [Rhizobium tubonense]
MMIALIAAIEPVQLHDLRKFANDYASLPGSLGGQPCISSGMSKHRQMQIATFVAAIEITCAVDAIR